MRYIGTIIRVNPSNNWGFIDRKSIKLNDGTPTTLETAKDIYLHREDCGLPLSEGLEVAFDITTDDRRPNAFRALDAQQVVYEAPKIELHIDDTHVDNPSIPMRWCFSAEMHKHITAGLLKGFGYAVMIVAKQHGDDSGYREIREVRSWLQPFTITTFGASGEWDASIVLYERKDIIAGRSTSYLLEQGIKSKFLAFTRNETGRSSFDRAFPDLHEFVKPEKFSQHRYVVDDSSWYGEPIAVRTITVHVPSEIFAKEPSSAVKAFGSYFFRYQPDDQCDLRRRLFIMVPGLIPYLFFETIKRLFLLVFSMGSMLFCVQDWWKIGDHALEPKIKVSLNEGFDVSSVQASPFNQSEGSWFWFTPGFLIIYYFAARILLWLGKFVLPPLKWLAMWLIHLFTVHHKAGIPTWFYVVAVFVAVFFGVRYAVRRCNVWLKETESARRHARHERIEARRREDHEYAIELGQQQAALAERYTAALVCGDAPAAVALRAIPQELRTRQMIFAAFKQKVCRPFAR